VTPTADEIRRSLEVRIAELETELRQLSAALDALTAAPGTMTSDHEMRADAPRSAATATGADRLIPHAIVRICQRWDAEGRHAQAAAVWQRDRWMAAMPDHAGMLRDLPNRLDRSIVRQRVRDAPATTRGMFEAMVIVYVWGWSVTSAGVTRAQSALGASVERLGSALLAEREARRSSRRLRGAGRSASREGTRSRLRLQVPLLRFTSRQPRSDSRPARGGLARSGNGMSLNPTRWSARTYAAYLSAMDGGRPDSVSQATNSRRSSLPTRLLSAAQFGHGRAAAGGDGRG
jgi:hypothetical protein